MDIIYRRGTARKLAVLFILEINSIFLYENCVCCVYYFDNKYNMCVCVRFKIRKKWQNITKNSVISTKIRVKNCARCGKEEKIKKTIARQINAC